MRLVPAIVLLAGVDVAGASAASADRHRQVDAVFAPWSGTTTPGCAVGVSRDGVVDYTRGYGMANLEHDAVITPETIFHVASISKQVTAFVIRSLAQEGKLSLADDIRKYVPEMPSFGKPITISHLIHHTSGLREGGQLLHLAGWRAEDVVTEADMLRVATRQRGLNHEPGAESLYNNTGYTLLAVTARRVSGKTLRELVEERIVRPLGLSHTHFHSDHNELVRHRASGYIPREGGGWRVSVPQFDHYGSTNLMTTVGDLLTWTDNFVHARAGGRALVEAMQKPGTLSNGMPIGYASGLRIGTYRGLRMVGHDGLDAGYRADLITFPDQRLTIVALCNSASIAARELTRKVADVYLADRLSTAVPPAVTVPEAQLSALAGVYWSPQSDEVVRLELVQGTLRRLAPPATVVPQGNGVFRTTDGIEEWRVTGAPLELRILDYWPVPRVFTRVTTPVPAASAMAQLTGQYRSDELETTYTVQLAAGKLMLRWARQAEVALEAVGGDRFVGTLGTVTFTRTGAGAVDGLTISNRRLRRFRAARCSTTVPC